MRRPFGVMFIGVLAAALMPHVASASYAPILAAAPTIQSALMQRIFGESSDASASNAAALGDRESESPLRAYALRVTLPKGVAEFAAQPVVDDDLIAASTLPQVTFAARASAPLAPATATLPPVAFGTSTIFHPVTANYQPLMTTPSVSAGLPSFQVPSGTQSARNTSSLISFSPILSPIDGFGSSLGSIGGTGYAGSPTTAFSVPLGVRVGNLQVQTRFEGAQVKSPALSLQDQATGVGANFNVRAGARKVNVDLSSSFEHLTRNGVPTLAASNFDDTATLELPSDGAPVLVPAFANLNKQTLSTGFAVPVTQSITLGVKYDTQHLFGGYGSPGLANLDAQANTYGARLTYSIPHTSSALTFSAKHMTYQDNLLPINTYSQTGANLNFTVKF